MKASRNQAQSGDGGRRLMPPPQSFPQAAAAEPCDVSQAKSTADVSKLVRRVYTERHGPTNPSPEMTLREQCLKIPSEPRFVKMQQRQGGGPLARLAADSRGPGGRHHGTGQDAHTEATGVGISAPAAVVGDAGEKAEWQEAFDRARRRLLLDFELSEVPTCRLNHLERMHSWFTAHGEKPPPAPKPGPNYIAFDRKALGEEVPAGSAMTLPIIKPQRGRGKPPTDKPRRRAQPEP